MIVYYHYKSLYHTTAAALQVKHEFVSSVSNYYSWFVDFCIQYLSTVTQLLGSTSLLSILWFYLHGVVVEDAGVAGVA